MTADSSTTEATESPTWSKIQQRFRCPAWFVHVRGAGASCYHQKTYGHLSSCGFKDVTPACDDRRPRTDRRRSLRTGDGATAGQLRVC
ncbi:hypothetical protein JOF29_007232 [Kribbella aluminosa]|uniref:Uncharacterized protein n=1 Tax=Kribbella aluminosa TaxID=416017 RepID=A0ABS4UWV3_9ACTN|nr:hypothetical protein [Kribbella aluminosa]